MSSTGHRPDRSARLVVALAFPAQIAVLALLARLGAGSLNPDAVAYLRLADHWAEGRLDLAIVGYWGPLLSWLLVPVTRVVPDLLAATKLVMSATAVLFAIASAFFLSRLGLAGPQIAVGTWILSLSAAVWAFDQVTPDVLLAGLLLVAIGLVTGPADTLDRRRFALAGFVTGLAYLAKAVALPMGAAILFAITFGRVWARGLSWRVGLRRLGLAATVLLLTAAPWIAALSSKYGYLTFSTTAGIAHAVMGPPDVPRSHPPTRDFVRPPEGRLTAWEDPSELSYPAWSPFGSRSEFSHQIRLVRRNVVAVAGYLSRFDLLGLALALGALGLVDSLVEPASFERQRWRLGWAALIPTIAIYLPVYAAERRYYYLSLALLVAMALGLLWELARRSGHARLLRGLGLMLLVVSWGASALLESSRVVHEPAGDSFHVARVIARALTDARVTGPIATIGDDPHAGMYVGLLLETPVHGHRRSASVEQIAASGAWLVLVRGETGPTGASELGPAFERLSPRLALPSPWRAYVRKDVGPATIRVLPSGGRR